MSTRIKEEAQFESHWGNLVGTVCKQWPEIPQEKIIKIKGNRQALIRVISKTYNISRIEADNQLHMWINQSHQ